jgi:hypothetical protein
MFVSQPVVIREYKQVIDNIYENIIKRENHLFTIDASDKMEETLKNVLSKHGLDQILNEIDSSLIDEIKIHFSYERKKWEWTIVYQMLLTLSLQSEFSASEEEYKLRLSESDDENQQLHRHYTFAEKFYLKIRIVLDGIKKKIRDLSSLLGIDGFFIFLGKLMDKSRIVDIVMRVIGTVIVSGLAIVASFIAGLRWLQNPIEKTLRSLARLLGIKPPDDDDL